MKHWFHHKKSHFSPIPKRVGWGQSRLFVPFQWDYPRILWSAINAKMESSEFWFFMICRTLDKRHLESSNRKASFRPLFEDGICLSVVFWLSLGNVSWCQNQPAKKMRGTQYVKMSFHLHLVFLFFKLGRTRSMLLSLWWTTNGRKASGHLRVSIGYINSKVNSHLWFHCWVSGDSQIRSHTL